jgi:4-diphosphocytidyl-2-C-methyl-D-erythritol kinase
MFPVGLCDILEIRQNGTGKSSLEFTRTGIPVEGGNGTNLCEKAYWLLAGMADLAPVRIHLHKQVPVGAGLGGGSSNATLTLTGLDRLFRTGLSREALHEMAAKLGSDCPFFLYHQPMMMEGRGEILTPCNIDLDGLYMVILFPRIHISTAEAYAGIVPTAPEAHLKLLVKKPIDEWKTLVVNDFEKTIFRKYPDLKEIKNRLYRSGALYASLSGSGSALYGIFPGLPDLPADLSRQVIWKGPALPPVPVS